jgi:hypothetical protein
LGMGGVGSNPLRTVAVGVDVLLVAIKHSPQIKFFRPPENRRDGVRGAPSKE